MPEASNVYRKSFQLYVRPRPGSNTLLFCNSYKHVNPPGLIKNIAYSLNCKVYTMKKVLIITYYWPPSGGGGVMRWLKMSKFLPELGWQPIIYTPENPDPSVTDESLLKEIHPEIIEIKTPIWEPYDVYRKLTGKKSGAKFKAGYISEASEGNWKSKLSVFVRGNFLIPDPRKFWINPSVKYLTYYLEENPVDLIISTGPPHSMHLIALGLKEKFDIPWIADFRDPWTDIDFYHKLKLTGLADKKHRLLEKKVLEKADHVVTVSPGCANDLEKIAQRKVEVINNGFDPTDYDFEAPVLDKTFTISHFGAFNKDRNPASFWMALNQLSEINPDFKKLLRIQLIGQTDESIIKDIKKNNLGENLILTDHLPHKEGLVQLSKSQVLLLPLNDAPNVKGILPGKMYEYMALRRPILALGPVDADYAAILRETNAGVPLDFQDVKGIMETLQNYFQLFKEDKLEVDSGAYEKFSRKNLAKQFVNLIQS
jgi:glycosyltransferase involved in cell wall biosynthesis